jgi:hypothetical protein
MNSCLSLLIMAILAQWRSIRRFAAKTMAIEKGYREKAHRQIAALRRHKLA